MPFNEGWAQRLREHFTGRQDDIEKCMYGVLALMLSGHLCVRVTHDKPLSRIDPDADAEALKQADAPRTGQLRSLD